MLLTSLLENRVVFGKRHECLKKREKQHMCCENVKETTSDAVFGHVEKHSLNMFSTRELGLAATH